MNNSQIIETLQNQKVLPIFRGSHEEIKKSLELMAPLQLKTIELTTSVPNWQALLKELSSIYQVGLGTIKTKSDISDARANGANFLVSFGAFTDLVNVNEEIPVIPGALTPTEFLQLHRSGINLAKLYPASSFGAKYLKDLKVLLPEMNFIVTGGIGTSKAELETWLSAGAVAIGIGSNLGNPLKDATAFQKKVAELVTALS